MGKIEIKKKECKIDRCKVFGKRHRGLIKKAYELSVLCGVDVAVVMYSPGDVLRQFSSHPRLEKILQRFVHSIPKMPQNERENLQISQDIINRINLAAGPADMEDQRGPDAPGQQEINPEIVDLQTKLMLLKQQLKVLDPGVETFGSEQQFEEHIQRLERIRSIIVNKRHQNEYERSFHQIPFTNPLQIVQNNGAQIKSEAGSWGPVYGGEQQVQWPNGDPSSSFDHQAPPFMPYLVSSEVSLGHQEQTWQHGLIGDPCPSSYATNNPLFAGQNAQNNGMDLYGGVHWAVGHPSPASCSSMQVPTRRTQIESQAGMRSSLQHALLQSVKTEPDEIYPLMFTTEQRAGWEVGGPSDAHQEPVQQKHVTKQEDPCSSAYPANKPIFNIGEQNSVFGRIKLETTETGSSPVSNILGTVPPEGHGEENARPAAGHPPSASRDGPGSTVPLEKLTWEEIFETTDLENLTWDKILQATEPEPTAS